MAGDRSPDKQVSFREAFRFWLKLGFISFGGPAGQIAIMHKELVDRRSWISEERFLHALNYCMLLPGPEAHQLAIYIGWLLHRVRGGIVAGVFFVLPSIFILLSLSYVYAAYGNVPLVIGAMMGFKPVVVAIVLEALLKIGKRAMTSSVHYVIAALAFIGIYLFHIPFPVIVLGAGILGIAGSRWWTAPAEKLDSVSSQGHDAELNSHHPRAGVKRSIGVVAAFATLWAIPFMALIAWQGSNSLHAKEYRFFTQAAFITFGGAYAVLAYVTQTVTAEPYNWITPAQAIDGLALAETTPGPLIMVLQFIGFMAGWNNPGSLGPLPSAVIGAMVTTYVTFLPSFMFILLGAPYIEQLRRNTMLTAALSGITAAVVGVILNLALVFGSAVILVGGTIDWFAALLTVAAFVLLFRGKVDVLWIVLAGGLIGIARVLLSE
jgi:chromate transporter